MNERKEPAAGDSTIFWNQPDKVLREVLRPFVEHPKTLINMTREELQNELRRQLKDSVGC